jgi:hypothetical protein
LSVQYSNLAQNEINDIDKQFMNNRLLDRLYFEMYSESPYVLKVKQLQEPIRVSPEMLKQEHHMSSIIFQKIADIYFCERLDHGISEDNIEWFNMFKEWMKSPILRENWKCLKHEQHASVQKFIDELLMAK